MDVRGEVEDARVAHVLDGLDWHVHLAALLADGAKVFLEVEERNEGLADVAS